MTELINITRLWVRAFVGHHLFLLLVWLAPDHRKLTVMADHMLFLDRVEADVEAHIARVRRAQNG